MLPNRVHRVSGQQKNVCKADIHPAQQFPPPIYYTAEFLRWSFSARHLTQGAEKNTITFVPTAISSDNCSITLNNHILLDIANIHAHKRQGWRGENRSINEGLKCLLTVWRPCEGFFGLKEVKKGHPDARKSLHEPPVVWGQPQKAVKPLVSSFDWPISDGTDLLFQCADALNIHSVAQEIRLSLHKVALFCQSSCLNSSQHHFQRIQCGLKWPTMDGDVIQILQALFHGNVWKHCAQVQNS